MANEFKINDAMLEALLDTEDGPVGQFLGEAGDRFADQARALAPVREGNVWNEATTSAKPPGYLKASIHGKTGRSARTGHIYGSANAMADPAIFMEYPAVQLHYPRPFLTTALFSTTVL